MTLKSERLRQRMAALQTELQEAEKVEKRRARERAQRALARAARRSGLIAALSQREGAHAAVLEREFARIAAQIDEPEAPSDAAPGDREWHARTESASDGKGWHGDQGEEAE